MLALSPEKRKLAAQEVQASDRPLEEQLTESPYTLEEFSYQFFRCSPHSEGYRKAGLAGTQPGTRGGEGGSHPARSSRGRESLSTDPHTSLLWQGSRERDYQQGGDAHGPKPGPSVGLLPRAFAPATAQICPRQSQTAGFSLPDVPRYPSHQPTLAAGKPAGIPTRAPCRPHSYP